MTQSIIQSILARATSRNPWKLVAATAALAAGATTAGATIVATVPDAVELVLTDVRLNQSESDVEIRAFNERGNGPQCFQLPYDLQTDHSVIPKFTWVKSHFIHADPVTTLLLDGRVRFDTQIIGVISSSAGLDATDALLGRPGTTYPPPGTEPNRGLEATQADAYAIVGAGFVIAVRVEVPPPPDAFSDQIRVITACTQPPG